jgi:superfamily I DNA/RNA helicase
MAKFQFFLPTNLTRIQQRVVDSREPIFLSGVPGTGKTVVSIRRLQNAAALKKKAIIFTYGKLLKKTIQEKLANEKATPVDNINNWMWNVQDDGQQISFKKFTSNENLSNAVLKLKSKNIKYDEILVDEGQDLSINTYKILKELTPILSISADNAQQINNKENATDEETIEKLFPDLKKIELDEVFRSAYELYHFAIQFVPYNGRANDPALLERLQNKNSGADKPLVYLEKNLNGMYETVRDIIDDNPTDNIGILFEKIIHVDEFTKKLSEDYELSTYHSIQKVVPSELKNIIITTFKSAKGIEFDIVIIPYFPDGALNIPEEYYVGVTRAKNQVHFLAIKNFPTIMSKFNKNTYKLVDNRG